MKVFTPVILICIALLLSLILLPISLIYSVGSLIKNRCDQTTWYNYFYRTALGIDELGNTVCSRLFNDLLIDKATGYHFGLDGETISSALGKNVERGTLRFLGKALNWLLNKIQANHAILSINNTVNNIE